MRSDRASEGLGAEAYLQYVEHPNQAQRSQCAALRVRSSKLAKMWDKGIERHKYLILRWILLVSEARRLAHRPVMKPLTQRRRWAKRQAGCDTYFVAGANKSDGSLHHRRQLLTPVGVSSFL